MGSASVSKLALFISYGYKLPLGLPFIDTLGYHELSLLMLTIRKSQTSKLSH